MDSKQTKCKDLLTHEYIRGNLSKNKAVKQAKNIFIDKKGEALKLVSNDTRLINKDSDKLMSFLLIIKKLIIFPILPL